jgi:RsiW-degrading membrane proteinase PrsW (M82 family)
MQATPDTQTEPITAPTLWQVFISVAWSFFGVQNSRTRHRDFTYGKPWQFIVLGFVMTVLVVLGFAAAAQLALHFALQP